MTPPILFDKILHDRDLMLALRKEKLKMSDLKKVCYANGKTLVLLKKRVKNKPPKKKIPSRELEREIVSVDGFVERYRALIERERIAEIEAQIKEIRNFSARERELFGRAVLELSGRYEGEKFHYYLVRFSRERPIETEMAAGDVVLISRGDPLKSDLTGTLYEIKKRYLVVAFEQLPPKWIYHASVRMDLFINDVTFKRMEENLEIFRHIGGKGRRLRNIILRLERPDPPKPLPLPDISESLNPSQERALSSALGSKELFLIHGPPGTGKTRTLIALIEAEVAKGRSVLATADSNVAVDNMLVRLAQKGLRLVRIGHPVRIAEALQRYSVHYLYERHIETEAIKMGWEEIRALAKERENYAKPTAARSRGLGYDRIQTLASRGKSHRGISQATMGSMAAWIKMDKKIARLAEDLRSREEAIYRKIILEADVVLTTNSMAKSQMMEGIDFDIAVIDEGSQQVLPSTLIPIMKARRFVIAGDHRQLPPTVISGTEALERSLFEDLIEDFRDHSRMLRIQYRMHEKIMAFSNRHFYGGKLIADASVKDRTLASLSLKTPRKYGRILSPEEPVVFVDTIGRGREERSTRSSSYSNTIEAEIVVSLCEEALAMGLDEEQIGVITPYAAQVKTIRKMFETREMAIETKSVDGFQGREKEVILISFVRANPERKIGFLKERRRLNVALTRAKSKLICIGDGHTLLFDPLYRELLAYIRDEGRYLAWEED